MKRKRGGNDTGSSTPKKARAGASTDDIQDEIVIATPQIETPSKKRRGRPSRTETPRSQLNGNSHLTNGDATPTPVRKLTFSTPKKSQRRGGEKTARIDGDEAHEPSTPSRKPKASPLKAKDATPASKRTVSFTTPTKLPAPDEEEPANETPTLVRNADRSARRKSTRKLIERAITGEASGEEASDEDDALAQQILDGEREGDDAADDADAAGITLEEKEVLPETPSKRGRGRPKGSRNKRLPTPPGDLPPHELYFFQNRPGGTKTSNNTFPSQLLLDHEKYFAAINTYMDSHEEEREFLLSLHRRSFDQWAFELRNGFNICLYGYGSKRSLALDFAEHLHQSSSTPPKIVVVNGYAPGLTPRDVLTTILNAVQPKDALSNLPSHPTALLSRLMTSLTASPPQEPILLIIASVDALPFRRLALQSLLIPLASHPSISLLASADTPTFPLLWDVSARAALRFLFHDCTTFAPFSAEIDAVDATNELLGRRGRGRLTGRDGVAYVLRSLPENARALFRVIVAEQLKLEEDVDPGGGHGGGRRGAERNDEIDDDRGLGLDDFAASLNRPSDAAEAGVEYRTLYHKAVESFICSSEMAFRTLLKEFQDHAMVESRRDPAGVERLWVPYRKEELEGLLEDMEAVEGL